MFSFSRKMENCSQFYVKSLMHSMHKTLGNKKRPHVADEHRSLVPSGGKDEAVLQVPAAGHCSRPQRPSLSHDPVTMQRSPPLNSIAVFGGGHSCFPFFRRGITNSLLKVFVYFS